MPHPSYLDVQTGLAQPRPRSEADAVWEGIAEQMRQTAVMRIAGTAKARAKAHLAAPLGVDTIEPFLSALNPVSQAVRLAELLEIERHRYRRHVGFGGETVFLNIKGALLAARFRRRVMSRDLREREAA